MRFLRSLGPWLLSAALLAACGDDPDVPGSGSPSGAPTTKGNFTSVVSFGDSYSDAGTYTPATSVTADGAPPYIGGRFTNNSTGASVWVENVATSLGLLVTPAEIGFGDAVLRCPAAAANPALAFSCTAYGQGGARVSNPDGIGNSIGFMTVPLTTQIENHLQRVGNFKPNDLILVLGGNNDAFTQFAAFTAAAAQAQADAATGKITPEQANQVVFAAQQAALQAMKTAAQELSNAIVTQILGKGGKYVAVLSIFDGADTPFAGTLPAEIRPVLSQLSQNFNLWLRDGLTGQPVQLIDADSIAKGIIANPAKYGLSNVTVPTCDAAKISAITGGAVNDGNALFCNSTVGVPWYGIRDGADVNTWLWADSGHLTTAGHKLMSDLILEQLKAFGWI